MGKNSQSRLSTNANLGVENLEGRRMLAGPGEPDFIGPVQPAEEGTIAAQKSAVNVDDVAADLANTLHAESMPEGEEVREVRPDVNGDCNVSALDALQVINEVSRIQNGSPSIFEGTRAPHDVNGDGNVTALDALVVINRLAENEGSYSLGSVEIVSAPEVISAPAGSRVVLATIFVDGCAQTVEVGFSNDNAVDTVILRDENGNQASDPVPASEITSLVPFEGFTGQADVVASLNEGSTDVSILGVNSQLLEEPLSGPNVEVNGDPSPTIGIDGDGSGSRVFVTASEDGDVFLSELTFSVTADEGDELEFSLPNSPFGALATGTVFVSQATLTDGTVVEDKRVKFSLPDGGGYELLAGKTAKFEISSADNPEAALFAAVNNPFEVKAFADTDTNQTAEVNVENLTLPPTYADLLVHYIEKIGGVDNPVPVREPTFSDVPLDHPLSEIVEYAVASDWLDRTQDTLNLDGPLTYQQLVDFMFRVQAFTGNILEPLNTADAVTLGDDQYIERAQPLADRCVIGAHQFSDETIVDIKQLLESVHVWAHNQHVAGTDCDPANGAPLSESIEDAHDRALIEHLNNQ